MKTAPFKNYQQQLISMRSALLAQIEQQRGGVVSRAEVAADHFGHAEDSQAQVATARDLEFALGERETAELGAIDAALHRITAGNFGECTDCGTHLPAARLQVAPDAARCVPCQEKIEHQR